MGLKNYSQHLFEGFEYSEDSPTFLKSKNTKKVVGSLDLQSDGTPKAYRVSVNGSRYLVHRVIWVLFNGEIDPNLVIDHVDGNPLNNKIDNLRLVTRQLNQRNRKMLKNNKSGENGICFHTTKASKTKSNEYMRVTWYEGFKQKHKDFNLNKFGSKEDAIEFGELLRQLALVDKETYTERHGK